MFPKVPAVPHQKSSARLMRPEREDSVAGEIASPPNTGHGFGFERDTSMINQQTVQGNWNEIKGKLLSKWGELTDDDMAMFNGNVDQLMGTIQRKTGAARESIENFLGQITSGGAAAISGVGDSARAGAHQAMESIQASSDAAAAAVRDGYADLEAIVRKRPAESLLACFGVGLVTGVVVSLLLQRK